MRMKKLLFVCSQNRLRSPTAEQVFSRHDDVETASAGLNHDAEVPLSAELVEWADLIFVMEKTHRNKLRSKFKRHLRDHQRVICLDIPDDYDYMEPALVQLLNSKISRYL
jgi:predicted protein tyrosine phosphatase